MYRTVVPSFREDENMERDGCVAAEVFLGNLGEIAGEVIEDLNLGEVLVSPSGRTLRL